jgi:hypothetical protein
MVGGYRRKRVGRAVAANLIQHPGPRSSGDRAPPSGGGGAGSNPAGGTSKGAGHRLEGTRRAASDDDLDHILTTDAWSRLATGCIRTPRGQDQGEAPMPARGTSAEGEGDLTTDLSSLRWCSPPRIRGWLAMGPVVSCRRVRSSLEAVAGQNGDGAQHDRDALRPDTELDILVLPPNDPRRHDQLIDASVKVMRN